jgi:hypothetical protein
MVEGMEEKSNALCGAGFMMPNLYSKFWTGYRADAREKFIAYTEDIQPILKIMESVLEKTEARGKRWAANYRNFLRFATEYPLIAAKIIEAKLAYEAAKKTREAKDFRGYGEQIDRTVSLLQEAVKLSEKALMTWKGLIVNPTDLGTLAGLNAYGHDYLKGLAWQVYLESQVYGFSL